MFQIIVIHFFFQVFLKPARELIREAPVHIVIDGKLKSGHIFLMTDILVLAQLVEKSAQLKLIAEFPLIVTTVIPNASEPKIKSKQQIVKTVDKSSECVPISFTIKINSH